MHVFAAEGMECLGVCKVFNVCKALLQTSRSQLVAGEAVTAHLMAQMYISQMRERLGETAPVIVPSSPRQPAQPAGMQDAAAPATPPQMEQVLMGESPQHSPLLPLPVPELPSPVPELDLDSETVVEDEGSCADSYASDADSYASDASSDADSDTIAEQYHDFALDKHANAVASAVTPVPPALAETEPERPAFPPTTAAGLVQGAVRPLGVAGGAPPTQNPGPPAPRNGGVGAPRARLRAAPGAALLVVVEACGFAAAVVRRRSSFHACMLSSLCGAIIRGCSVSGILTPMVLQ